MAHLLHHVLGEDGKGRWSAPACKRGTCLCCGMHRRVNKREIQENGVEMQVEVIRNGL